MKLCNKCKKYKKIIEKSRSEGNTEPIVCDLDHWCPGLIYTVRGPENKKIHWKGDSSPWLKEGEDITVREEYLNKKDEIVETKRYTIKL